MQTLKIMAKSNNKTTENDASVMDFLDRVKDETQKKDSKRIVELMEKATGMAPKMWGTSIIGFGSYHYKYESGREGDMLKVGFSPRVKSISLYMSRGYEKFPNLSEKLGKFSSGKSCFYIKRLADVDEKILQKMFKESYKHMTKKYG